MELAARERENGVESMGAGEQNPAPGREDWAKRLTMAEEAIRRLFGTLSQDVTPIDSTLVDAVRNSEEKMLYQLDRLKGKISRAAVQRSELLSRHEQDLLNFLMPGGSFQEREISGIYFLARAGYGLLDRLLSEIPASRAEHQLFVY